MMDEPTLRLLGDFALWLALALGLALTWHAVTTIFSRPPLTTTPLPTLLREEAELWKDLPPGWQAQLEQAHRSHRPGTPCDLYDLGVALLLLAILGLPFLQFTLPAAPMPSPSSGEAAAASANTLTNQDILSGVSSVLLLTTFLLVYLLRRHRSLSEWFGLRALSWGEAIPLMLKAILWTFLASLLVYRCADWLLRWLWAPLDIAMPPQEIVQTAAEAQSWSTRLFLLFSACIVAPWCEEALFRGFLYPVCRRYTSPVFAALFVSLTFGLIHANLQGVLPLALLGLALCLAYEYSRGLALPVVMHMLFNATTLFQLWRSQFTPLS